MEADAVFVVIETKKTLGPVIEDGALFDSLVGSERMD